jgi:hypothetical protein
MDGTEELHVKWRKPGSKGEGLHVFPHMNVRKMIFSIKVFVILLNYLKIPQVAILGDLHV